MVVASRNSCPAASVTMFNPAQKRCGYCCVTCVSLFNLRHPRDFTLTHIPKGNLVYIFPGLDRYYAVPAQPLTTTGTAGEELDDLDHDLSDVQIMICLKCGTRQSEESGRDTCTKTHGTMVLWRDAYLNVLRPLAIYRLRNFVYSSPFEKIYMRWRVQPDKK